MGGLTREAWAALLENPAVGIRGRLHKIWQVPVFKGSGFSLLFSILVDARESGVEEIPNRAIVGPDRTRYVSIAERMDWFVCVLHSFLHCFGLRLL